MVHGLTIDADPSLVSLVLCGRLEGCLLKVKTLANRISIAILAREQRIQSRAGRIVVINGGVD